MLRNPTDAEDSFQATFLVLARKAGSIQRAELLANWLYGVARRVAAKARAASFKRRLRERAMHDLDPERLPDPLRKQGTDLDPVEMSELRSVLDEEVGRLPKRYRLPFVLCYLQGATDDAAARQLRCPKGTVQSRLSWARRRLRQQLTRRGFALIAVLAGIDLIADSAKAQVSTALSGSTVKAAIHYAAGHGLASGAVSASVATLTQGVLHTMFIIKMKTMAAAALVVLLAGTVLGVIARPNLSTLPARSTSDGPEPTVLSPDVPEQPRTHRTGDGKVEAKEVVNKTFQTGSKPTLKLNVFNGPIDVVASEENGVKVRLIKESRASTEELAKQDLQHIQVTMSQDRDMVTVRATKAPEAKSNEQLRVSAEVQVPQESLLVLATSNGAVTMKGGKNSSWVANTSNGAISAENHAGALHLHTSNGPIHVSGGTGPLDLTTSNGTIEMDSVHAKVDAHSSNGPIRFKGKFLPGQENLTTSNGSVIVDIPSDSQFKINATTSNGLITTGFALESSGKKRKTHLEGNVGSGADFSLEIHTSNGNIVVNPLAPAKAE
jgi:RNA polymerase sigma factor (sigma-70 family)